ncbi:hypothetical protein [Anaerostipes sp.]|uniref:hypothetical protein n=1 Tax=Anaerostipes sp. TaxID=1872530 RepID=UPI0025BE1A25|nr:hypothetical protein [Anaerostipes sp.]MBS7008796.1 hypothetical protein [Anaerostipes sp.]
MVFNKNIKNYLVFLLIMFIFVFGSSVYSYGLLIERNNSVIPQNYDQGDWLLSDNYDRKGHSYENFLREKNSLETLQQVYQHLLNIKNIDYYEISNQNFIYNKRFNGSKNFINGEGNQKVNGMLITPLKSIQVSELYVKKQNLNLKVHSGSFFDQSAYKKTSRQIIPVVAGANYQHIFKLNSILENSYLATQNIRCKIIGFLDKNTTASIDGENINLDNYLIMPSIKLSTGDTLEFKKILLSDKCEGYLHYNNKKEYHEMARQIKKIVKETGYEYIIPPEIKYNLYHLSIAQTLLIFLLSALALMLAVRKLYRESFIKPGNYLMQVTIKHLSVYFGWLFSAYLISQIILLGLYPNHRNIFIRTRLTTVIFFLSVGSFLTLLSVIRWKKGEKI